MAETDMLKQRHHCEPHSGVALRSEGSVARQCVEQSRQPSSVTGKLPVLKHYAWSQKKAVAGISGLLDYYEKSALNS